MAGLREVTSHDLIHEMIAFFLDYLSVRHLRYAYYLIAFLIENADVLDSCAVVDQYVYQALLHSSHVN